MTTDISPWQLSVLHPSDGATRTNKWLCLIIIINWFMQFYYSHKKWTIALWVVNIRHECIHYMYIFSSNNFISQCWSTIFTTMVRNDYVECPINRKLWLDFDWLVILDRNFKNLFKLTGKIWYRKLIFFVNILWIYDLGPVRTDQKPI